MIDYNDSKRLLVIKYIEGNTLRDSIRLNVLDLENFLKKIIEIDKFIFKNRINVLHLSPKDLIIDKRKNVFLIDFEYTFLDSRFKQRIYDKLFHHNLKKNNPIQFFEFIKQNKKGFYKNKSRKIINGLIKLNRMVLLRFTKKVRNNIKFKQRVSY